VVDEGQLRVRVTSKYRSALSWAVAVVSFVGLVAACGSSAHEASPAPTTEPHPLALQSNGTIDPNRVDLSGITGVTPAEQHRAEQLLRTTIVDLRRWNDTSAAQADGFVSMHDGFTGAEHFVHWDWIEDRDVLDPSHPESLVYRVEPDGVRVLEAAMFVMPKRYDLSDTPDIGGSLTQFHVHDKLCFDDAPIPKFFRNVRSDGTCIKGLVKKLMSPMLHVWIRPNPCGPFAPIGGFAAGKVKDGERVACDRQHGSASDA
jgi:hypothetical protein